MKKILSLFFLLVCFLQGFSQVDSIEFSRIKESESRNILLKIVSEFKTRLYADDFPCIEEQFVSLYCEMGQPKLRPTKVQGVRSNFLPDVIRLDTFLAEDLVAELAHAWQCKYQPIRFLVGGGLNHLKALGMVSFQRKVHTSEFVLGLQESYTSFAYEVPVHRFMRGWFGYEYEAHRGILSYKHKYVKRFGFLVDDKGNLLSLEAHLWYRLRACG